MKKVLIIISIALGIYFLVPQENTKSVFQEQTNGTLKYQIILENNEVNTNNFVKYFINYQVESISPYIHPLYKNKAKPIQEFTFDYTTMGSNIEKFTKKYISFLEKKGYKQEALKARLSGIIIEKVVIYSEEEEIIKLKEWLPNLKYEKIS